MNDQERLRKYEMRNLAQCDRIAILEAQNKQQADRIAELEKLNANADSVIGYLRSEREKQADRIGVLEANHEIQKNINEKALQYIEQLEQGLRASLDLNKAQAKRQIK